jgi:hypothetical protein
VRMMRTQVRAQSSVKPGEPSDEHGPQNDPEDRASPEQIGRASMAHVT